MKSQLWILGLFVVAALVVGCGPQVVDTDDDADGAVIVDERDARDPTNINVYEDDNPDTVVVEDNEPDSIFVDDNDEPSTVNNNNYYYGNEDTTADTTAEDDSFFGGDAEEDTTAGTQ